MHSISKNKEIDNIEASEKTNQSLKTDERKTTEDYKIGSELFDFKKSTGEVIDWKEKKRNNLEFSKLLWVVYDRGMDSDNYDKDIYTYVDGNGCRQPLVSYGMCHTVYNCAGRLTYKQDNETGNKKLDCVRFCRHRLCPMCNWRKSLKMYNQITKITNQIQLDNPNYGYLFVTLTLKNCKHDEIDETLRLMNKGYQKIFGRKHLKRYNKLHISLKGSIKFIEVTYSRWRDDYNLHIHTVLCVDNETYKGKNYIQQDEYREMWQKALGVNYLPGVNVKRIRTVTQKNAVAEVSKYPIKGDFILTDKMRYNKKLEVLSRILKEFRGKRFIAYYGIFDEYKDILKLDDIENGDLIHTDDEDTEKIEFNNVSYLLYDFNYKTGIYKLTKKV